MEKAIIILFLIIGKFGIAQDSEHFYEQIAFDKYRSEIIDSFPVKKRIKVYKYASDFHSTLFWFKTPSCLSGVFWKSNDQFKPIKKYTESQLNFDSGRLELNFTDLNKKQFKIKRFGRGSYPKLFISPPHIENGNEKRVFINIYEKHSDLKFVVYHLEFNNSGEIKNWCRSVTETTIIK